MENLNSGLTTVLGRSIYYKFVNNKSGYSQKPLLVFLHEGLGCSAQWKDFPNLVAEQLECPALMYDRYGYGKSETVIAPRKPGFLNGEALEFLPGVLKNLGLENRKILLFGHSDGGSIALIFAAAFPENVVAVITEAAHVFIENISVDGIRSVSVASSTGNLKEKLSKYHGNNTESMINSWVSVWLHSESKQWNIEHLLQQITCPVLAIQGTNDQFGTYAQLQSIQKNVSGSVELFYIENCGHIPHVQAKKEVLKKTFDFYQAIKNY